MHAHYHRKRDTVKWPAYCKSCGKIHKNHTFSPVRIGHSLPTPPKVPPTIGYCDACGGRSRERKEEIDRWGLANYLLVTFNKYLG